MSAWTHEKDHWQTIHPAVEWQTMKTAFDLNAFAAATEHFYINVQKK